MSASGSSSLVWPTATTSNGGDNSNSRSVTERGHGNNLNGVATNWPTPAASEARLGFQDRSDPGKKGTQESLSTIAVLWPTASARDWKGANQADLHDRGTKGAPLNEMAVLWSTPRAKEEGQWQNANRQQTKQTLTLTGQASQWATPTSLSFAESHQPGNSRNQNINMELASGLYSRLALTTVKTGKPSSKERRSLNPLFVEWLMGWPPSWTLLGWTDLGCSATALFRFKQHMRSALWQLDFSAEAPPAQLALFE
nr:hypothetical protein [Phyllobacterium leguminum]